MRYFKDTKNVCTVLIIGLGYCCNFSSLKMAQKLMTADNESEVEDTGNVYIVGDEKRNNKVIHLQLFNAIKKSNSNNCTIEKYFEYFNKNDVFLQENFDNFLDCVLEYFNNEKHKDYSTEARNLLLIISKYLEYENSCINPFIKERIKYKCTLWQLFLWYGFIEKEQNCRSSYLKIASIILQSICKKANEEQAKKIVEDLEKSMKVYKKDSKENFECNVNTSLNDFKLELEKKYNINSH